MFGDSLRRHFIRSTFLIVFDEKKVGKFVRLEQRDLTVAQYEAKFTELSRFTSQLIAIEEKKTLKFQDGLKPYLKNKISILKLGVYLEVVDRALLQRRIMKSFTSIGNNKGRGIGVMVLMVTKYRKSRLQVESEPDL